MGVREPSIGIDAFVARAGAFGLAPGTVDVVAYDRGWPELFGLLAVVLASVLGDGRRATIDHVGSTSVPGLPAKPVLDVAVGLASPDERTGLLEDMEAAGLRFVDDLGDFGGMLFWVSSPSNRTLAHVHVIERSDLQWRRYLAFRDGLRADERLRDEYADLKLGLARRYPGDRPAYTDAKFTWVLETVLRLDQNLNDPN